MRKFIWKLRYALRISERSSMNFKFCWYCAVAGMENLGDDWKDESPVDSADDELSCWSD